MGGPTPTLTSATTRVGRVTRSGLAVAALGALVSAMRAGQSVSRANGDPNWMGIPARGIASAPAFFLHDSGFRFSDQNIDALSKGRWRIRQTTISPTIVLEETAAALVIGAPGGGCIPTEGLQVIVHILDYGLEPLDAVRMPRIFPTAGCAPAGRRASRRSSWSIRATARCRADPTGPPRMARRCHRSEGPGERSGVVGHDRHFSTTRATTHENWGRGQRLPNRASRDATGPGITPASLL